VGYSTNASKLGVGDPFLHKRILGPIIRTVGGFLPRPIGKFVELAGQSQFFGGSGTTVTQAVPQPISFPGGFTGQPLQQTGKGGGGTATTTTTSAGTVSGVKKRRRMNVLNVKALRRSTRRLAGFQREAKKVEKELRKLAPQSRSRSRRDLGPHHTHVR